MHTEKGPFFSWFLQRITSIFLAGGLIAHFWVLHYLINKGSQEIGEVINRLTSTGWIIFYMCFLAALVYHGLNGMWAIFVDYNPGKKLKKVIYMFLYSTGIFTFIAGAVVLFWATQR
ncbi:MAG: succinate dehydrogenase, hydrophobic membrane anchor protein [Candidatus Brocadiales bacterium]